MVVVEQFDRSREQRMAALEGANEIRRFRARKKKEVAAGTERYDFFLTFGADHPLLRSMKVHEALMVMPHIGRVKAARILRAAEISHSKSLGGLTPQAWRRLWVAFESYPIAHKRLSEASRNVMP